MVVASEPWWRRGVIYQVYPRSFQDSNGDGVGDLDGVTARLPYIADLGVDAVWLSPFYPSPMADFGYDVSDHLGVDPLFGDLAGFARLRDAAHAAGLKLILDYIPNHTSIEHAWFEASRSSRNDPKRDWYIWRSPGPEGGPPNNWLSEFGGRAWTFDPKTGQYYYHAFLPEQPDLNWRNPQVVEAMLSVLDGWLARGADGFRVDAIHHLFEAESLADNPANPAWTPAAGPADRVLRARTVDQPEIAEAVRRMRQRIDAAGGERVLIGEAYLPLDRLVTYYGESLSGFHLPFNFHLMTVDWTPSAIAALVSEYEAQLPPGAWPNWVLGNHDRSRIASRLGPAQTRIAAMLLLTLRGTPTLYQGDELGLADTPIPPENVRDPWERNAPGLGLGRDPVRTPMPWSDRPQAGFTTGEPWLPLPPEWRRSNAAVQAGDPTSLLNLYRSLLRLRRSCAALASGDWRVGPVSEAVLGYERHAGEQRVAVRLNFSGEAQATPAPACVTLLSSHGPSGAVHRGGELRLAPHEGLILDLAGE